MNIETQKKEENPLFHREEIQIKIDGYEETPSREEVLEKTAAELGQDKETLVIDQINQERGKKESICRIKAYESPEHLEKYSKEYKKERIEQKEEEE